MKEYLDDFDDNEIKEEYNKRFVNSVTNIVEQSQLDEMVNLFLSFSLAKKEEILNNLRNG